jgi:hypothetical protein
MLREAIIIPAAATVYAQAKDISTAPVCGGLKLSALDSYRSEVAKVIRCLIATISLTNTFLHHFPLSWNN